MKRILLVVAVIAGLGCDASKDYSFAGDWQASGGLAGDVLHITQSGQDVSGDVFTDQYALPSGSVYAGTDANGDVSFSLQSFLADCGDNSGPQCPVWHFTGHFTNGNTVQGTMNNGFVTQAIVLMRVPAGTVYPV